MFEQAHVRALRFAVAALFLLPGCEIFGPATDGPADPPPVEDPNPPPPPPPPSGTVAIVANPASLVVPEGGTAAVGIRLSEQPDADVTVTVALASGSPVFSLQGSTSLVFTTGDWDTEQTVTVHSGTDADTQNDWVQLRLTADPSLSLLVDVTQEDSEGTPPTTQGVTLKIKDATGAGSTAYPVTAVVPLEYGTYQDTSGFRMLDPAGNPVPAQFEVVNRWWARDGSIRHVAAHFQATVPPGGQAQYTFETTGGSPSPAKAVTATQSGNTVTVDTGVLKFTVKKDAFNLFDEVWHDTNGDGSYATSERVVDAGSSDGPVFTGRLAGDIQRARERGDLRLVVEENGPMRAVIRVSGLTSYQSPTSHTHGFAVRIYAYAGKSMVKVDYQLQNSAKNKKYSWPLYFDDVSLHVKPKLTSPTVRLAPNAGNVWSGSVGNGRYLFQNNFEAAAAKNSSDNSTLKSGSNAKGEPSYGWADVSDGSRGLFVTVRHMAQMWPNGVEVASDNDVAVRLWPKWSAQWHNNSVSSSGLYWLEDMQHVYKEVLFWFHGPGVTTGEMDDLAKNFESHPIPFVPMSWYDKTRVTLDLDGILPTTQPEDQGDTKKIPYNSYNLDPSHYLYNFGWGNFGGNVDRRAAGGGGGWPSSASRIVGTERVDLWLTSEAAVLDDIQCRPASMAEYTRDGDFDLVRLVQQYGSEVWRYPNESLKRDNGPYLDQDYLSGTGWNKWTIRDNQHLWTYHVEEFYYFSYNLWIKDWYEFMSELRLSERFSTTESEHWWNAYDFSNNIRGEAHTWGNLLQCYRVTGDSRLKDHINFRMKNSLWPSRNLQYGVFRDSDPPPFENGFLARNMVQLMTEVRGYDQQLHDQAFQIVWGLVEWNHYVAQYCYRWPFGAAAGSQPSSGTTSTFVDTIGWFGLNTGRTEFLDRARTFVTSGLNGGEAAYGQIQDWTSDMLTKDRGGWLGRVTEYIMKFNPTPNPPAAIGNLTATATSGQVTIRWTTPARAARFHVVWGEKPFHTSFSIDTSKLNPWAGMPVGNSLKASPGSQQSLSFSAPSGKKIYVAVFTFDADKSMSAISNVASVDVP